MDIQDFINRGKIKRYLSARNRIIYPGGVYHVTHRAPGRELIFVEDKDYLRMLLILKETSKEFSWDVFAFVFMRNHFHILLRISEANLSPGMKKLGERYAKFFNTKYERKGPVFSRPYRAALCLDDAYLLSISIYIHLNPFRARLCEKIDKYRWSSLGLYIKEFKPSFLNPRFVLEILDEDMDSAKREYRRLLHKSANVPYKNIIEYPLHIDFFRGKIKEFLREKGILKEKIEEEIELVRDKMRSRNPQAILAKKYLIEQLLARGCRVAEISDKLKVSRKTVYNILNYTK